MSDLATQQGRRPRPVERTGEAPEAATDLEAAAEVRKLLAPLSEARPRLHRPQAEAAWQKIAAAQPRPRSMWARHLPTAALATAAAAALWLGTRSPDPVESLPARPAVAAAASNVETNPATAAPIEGRALAPVNLLGLGARVELRGEGRLLEDDAARTLLQLTAGELLAEVPPRDGRPDFEVLTALARVRVQGTVFAVALLDGQQRPTLSSSLLKNHGAADALAAPPGNASPTPVAGPGAQGARAATVDAPVQPQPGARRVSAPSAKADAGEVPVQVSVGAGVVEVVPTDGRPPMVLYAGETLILEPVSLDGAERSAGRGDLDEALAILLQLGPAENLDGRNRRLRLAQRFDALKAARAPELWTHLAALHPEGVHAETFLFHAGLAAHRAGRRTLARAHAARLIAHFPDSPRLTEARSW